MQDDGVPPGTGSEPDFQLAERHAAEIGLLDAAGQGGNGEGTLRLFDQEGFLGLQGGREENRKGYQEAYSCYHMMIACHLTNIGRKTLKSKNFYVSLLDEHVFRADRVCLMVYPPQAGSMKKKMV